MSKLNAKQSTTALLAGATGLVGGHVLDILLACPQIDRVRVLSRRPLARQHEKIHTIMADATTLAQVSHELQGDMVFCCLGTTIKKAGSRANFYHIDHDYALAVANYAKANGASRLALISALGADVQSRIFYNRVKGEAERDIGALGFEEYHILRPSLILGARDEKRLGEDVMKVLSGAINPLLMGWLKKYQAIHAKTIAQAMVDVMLNTHNAGTYIHENDRLLDYQIG